MAAVTTNADGRTDAPLVSADALETGVYELSFHAADYFHRMGLTQPAQPFLGVIVIRVGIADRFRQLSRAAAALAVRVQHLPRIMTSIEQAREVIRRCRQLARSARRRAAKPRAHFSPSRCGTVHSRLAGWMAAAGMTVRVDAAGNIRGVYPSPGRTARQRLFIGSHLDTVPNAGRIRRRAGRGAGRGADRDARRPAVSIQPRGGRILGRGRRAVRRAVHRQPRVCRQLRLLCCSTRRDAKGLQPGGRHSRIRPGSRLALAMRRPRHPRPVISNSTSSRVRCSTICDLPLAVVDAIVGTDARGRGASPAWRIMPAPRRCRRGRDALAGAAEWISVGGTRGRKPLQGLVATVGRVQVEPGAGNVIPGRCELSLDVRHADDAIRETAVEHLARAARDIALRRKLEVTLGRPARSTLRADGCRRSRSMLARSVETRPDSLRIACPAARAMTR